ncbi:hypothetical protein GJ496_002228 [Pomphorhynchus laevis]|nr:hypothetical protein GJ496_002228 [Pomphorhynchus laevis]
MSAARALRTMGVPEEIISDNGPRCSHLNSAYFVKNGIRHILAPSYHPQTNGLKERFIGTFKRRVKLESQSSQNSLAILQFLMTYRNTLQASTTKAHVEMLYGRRIIKV